ncbi:glutathione S-transferase T3-like protein [Tanacetum coccineum]
MIMMFRPPSRRGALHSERGNARKKDGFWVEVLEYVESTTNQEGRQTYDMVVGKWKVVRPAVVRFCGIYSNVMRMAQESGAGDKDYIQKAMIYYQAECGLLFKFRHCWEVLKDSPKFQEIASSNFNQGSQGSSKRQKSSGSSSFNVESRDASINLNNIVNDEDDVQEIRRPEGRGKAKNKGSKASGSSTMNDDALARLMVTELTAAEVAQREKFMELKRREVECREREIVGAEYRALSSCASGDAQVGLDIMFWTIHCSITLVNSLAKGVLICGYAMNVGTRLHLPRRKDSSRKLLSEDDRQSCDEKSYATPGSMLEYYEGKSTIVTEMEPMPPLDSSDCFLTLPRQRCVFL